MSWLLENPLPVLIVGLLGTLGLLAAAAKTGERLLWRGTLIAAVITGSLLALEYLVVTPREQVEADLFSIVEQVEKDNLPGVLARISKQSPQMAIDAQRLLAMYRIDSITIKSNLTIEVDGSKNPHTATASFNAVASGGDRRGNFGVGDYPCYLVVHFVREDGLWKVIRYEEHPFTGPGKTGAVGK